MDPYDSFHAAEIDYRKPPAVVLGAEVLGRVAAVLRERTEGEKVSGLDHGECLNKGS
jgi:hypothetical protein